MVKGIVRCCLSWFGLMSSYYKRWMVGGDV